MGEMTAEERAKRLATLAYTNPLELVTEEILREIRAAVAAEKERCAKVLDALRAEAERDRASTCGGKRDATVGYIGAFLDGAAAIRARGDGDPPGEE